MIFISCLTVLILGVVRLRQADSFYNLIGLVLDIIGLILGNSHQKETQLDYKTERILNIVGIVISVINWIAGILLTMNGFV